MKIKTVLSELKANVSPYMIFWEEWIVNENCNLTPEEIETINSHIRTNFEVSLLDKLRSSDKVEALEKISVKLNIAQRVFKEWVIVKFLFTIIELAKNYGYDSFLNTPVNQLRISDEIKEKLKSFKVYSLQQLFIIYKAEDFGRTWFYNNITDFLITIKNRDQILLNS